MNIYRLGLDASTLYRVTNVDTGVSGITPTSPAFSIADDASALAFTIYDRGRPRLIVLDQQQALAGAAMVDRDGIVHPAAAAGEPGTIDRYLADLDSGVPDPSTIANRTYHPDMSLEGVGQPYLSSGGGPFGTFVRAGGALLFGDMLGERRIGAAVQVGNRLRDAAFTVPVPEPGTPLELGRARRSSSRAWSAIGAPKRSCTTDRRRC